MEYVTAVSQIIYVSNDFKHNYKLLNGSIFPDRNPLYKLAYTLHALSLCHANLQQVCSIQIRNLSRFYHDIVSFMYDLYTYTQIYTNVFFYVFTCFYLLCNRAPWKNSLLNGLPCLSIF